MLGAISIGAKYDGEMSRLDLPRDRHIEQHFSRCPRVDTAKTAFVPSAPGTRYRRSADRTRWTEIRLGLATIIRDDDAVRVAFQHGLDGRQRRAIVVDHENARHGQPRRFERQPVVVLSSWSPATTRGELRARGHPADGADANGGRQGCSVGPGRYMLSGRRLQPLRRAAPIHRAPGRRDRGRRGRASGRP